MQSILEGNVMNANHWGPWTEQVMFRQGYLTARERPAGPSRQTAAKGMPIGNLSSQLFANIYLSDFDHWVKETLRVHHYTRYLDDMVILGKSPDDHIIHITCVMVDAQRFLDP